VRQGSHHDRVIGEPLSYLLLALSLSPYRTDCSGGGHDDETAFWDPFYRFRASQLYQDDRAKCQRGDRHARGKAPI